MTTPVVGQRLSYDGALCTVRYVGEVAGTVSGGTWLGVEWDDPTRGKHDGVHKGVRYFLCRRGHGADSRAASFVRPTRPADAPRTFLEAVREKYDDVRDPAATAATTAATTKTTKAVMPRRLSKAVVISGKVAEEVGFDKVRQQLAQLETLKVVLLDGMCVLQAGDTAQIRTVCPSIAELDLSRNLFAEFATVVAICRELPHLQNLRINGNRFVDIAEAATTTTTAAREVFAGVKELGIGETLLSWAEIGQLTTAFSGLATLTAGTNQLTRLTPSLPSTSTLPATLTTLNLEFNDFTALSDLASLADLRVLRHLHLKGCSIAHVVAPADTDAEADTDADAATTLVPRFAPSVQYLDLSYNRVASWAFIDALPEVFPGINALRFSHNPIYNSPYMDLNSAPATATATATATTTATMMATANMTASTEESYMIAVGRLGALKVLNFSNISATDRSNAEMFYLSRIAKQLAATPPDSAAEAAVLRQHRRYAELCALYGEPAVVRHTEINPAFLEARLITVDFVHAAAAAAAAETKKIQVQVPKSFDMYAVKSLAGRLFKASPQTLRLVWETGEWDPVGGEEGEEEEEEDEDDEDDNDDNDDEAKKESAADDPPADSSAPGRWIKREVELKGSPRQFGFCVDGMEATVRVEVRA